LYFNRKSCWSKHCRNNTLKLKFIMKKTGAWLVVNALEQLPISHTFGVPGVHNTEIYDELNKSKKITPILVTHEGGGAFMADAVSQIGRASCRERGGEL